MTPEFQHLVDLFRADLVAAQYTVSSVDELLSGGRPGTDAVGALRRGHILPALRALQSADHPLAVLVRLFRLGVVASEDELGAALRSLGTAGAESLGLVRREASGWRALLAVTPYAVDDALGHVDWWIVSDLGELATGGPLREDHVLGIGGASVSLSRQLVGRASRVTLDLGCGSGVQALHASRFSEHVIATDISGRALELARLTRALNGVSNIEFRAGSLFEPVELERFDTIVSNPPFVITPRTAGVPGYEYRDGGLVGDALVEALIRGVGAHLEVGGIAQLLANWEYRPAAHEVGGIAPHGAVADDRSDGTGVRLRARGRDSAGLENVDGLARVERWLDACPELDAWVIERERQDPSEYAETWIRDGGTRVGTTAFAALHASWLDDFERRGVEAIGFGYVLLRRRPAGAPVLRRVERADGALGAEGLSAHFDGVLRALDSLTAVGAFGGPSEGADAALRGVRLERAADVTEERHHWPGDEQPTVVLLRQGGGFGRALSVSPALSALVGAADGELPLGVLNDAIAQLLEVDAEALWAETAAEIRELVWCGMLRPAADE